jgi:hypothetical protein
MPEHRAKSNPDIINIDRLSPVQQLRARRAARVAAGDPIAIWHQAALDRAAAEQQEQDQRERDRLRRLLGLDEATKPTPRTRKHRVTLKRAMKQASAAGVAASAATLCPDGSVTLALGLKPATENTMHKILGIEP